jgi:hypothetical protein
VRGLSLLLAASATILAAPPAAAQKIARSAGPQSVSVTVYRAPYRSASEAINLGWLNGYALVSETRRVVIPAGETDIRFEGVSGGILPESAIVTGLPSGVVEKNQDALLLSPGSLVDASLGKKVHLRRTSRTTGKAVEMDAIVRSGPAGAVVIETEGKVEALRCSGLAETLRYDGVPPRLSAKPTLSVKVRNPRAATATVTLSYLASDFDWQANYVAEVAPDGKVVNLFAWLTLASGDDTSFVRADTQAVAGRLNRQQIRARRAQAPPLVLRCWPSGTTTSDLPTYDVEPPEEIIVSSRMAGLVNAMPAPMAPPPPPSPPVPEMMAQQEDLGDLKLYRIPAPVTVAAHSQKQVALLVRQGVKVETVHRVELYAPSPNAQIPVQRILKTKNLAERGLGLPLPAGGITYFTAGRARPLLLGRGSLEDKAVGEDVELVVGRSRTVTLKVANLSPPGKRTGEWEVEATNGGSETVAFEAQLENYGRALTTDAKLGTRFGRPLWSVTLAPGESAKLRYTAPAG